MKSSTAQKTDAAYVDTSALIALLDRSDSYHSVFRRLFADPPPLVTSSLVVAEGHGWFLRRYDQRRGMQFLAFLRELPELLLDPLGPDALADATHMLSKFPHQKLTLADAHGLAIMSARKIVRCWSTDRHLALTGVRLVI
jgi:predicted nucleic acid-binding protein